MPLKLALTVDISVIKGNEKDAVNNIANLINDSGHNYYGSNIQIN